MSPRELAVHALNALFPDFPQHVVLLEAMADVSRHFAWEYSEGQKMLDEWQPALELTGRRVLDVGSGSGAKSFLYAQRGACQVVGLELDRALVQRAEERLTTLAAAEPAARRVRFVHGDATRMPLPDATFDTLISIHAMEHIQPPERALAECGRVLRPGGRAYLRFPPYWSAWGPHLERWIRFPWCHLLFDDPTLIAAVNRIEAKKRLNDRYPDFLRLDLRGQTELPHVNKLTMAQFDQMVARLPMRVVGLRLLPVGYNFLPRLADQLGPLGAPVETAAALLRALAGARRGREILATKAVVVLEKTSV